jgi:cystathionine gamma-lyase
MAKTNTDKLGFDSRTIHAGQPPEPVTGAVMTPVFLTSTYAQKSPGVHSGYEYSRTHNPTRQALERCMASLEGGTHGFAFASGLGALTTVCSLFNAGDHIVFSDDVYGGTFRLFDKVMKRLGMQFTAVDMSNATNVEKAITPKTKMIWVESPTNPMLKLADIAAISKIAHKTGALCAVDNTFMSPYFQRPLELGADLVLHSTTKYINGHSDVVGGMVVVKEQGLADRLAFLQNAMGVVAGPMDCFLVTRGLKTLSIRMRAHEKSAMHLAKWLESHPKVDRVIYPGLESHPQHALAKKQMSGFGGMITFFIKGDLAACRRFLETVSVFTLAESLGGVESLVDHPAIMTHASIPAETRKSLGIDDNLVRLSVGIEDLSDLQKDLEAALAAV